MKGFFASPLILAEMHLQSYGSPWLNKKAFWLVLDNWMKEWVIPYMLIQPHP